MSLRKDKNIISKISPHLDGEFYKIIICESCNIFTELCNIYTNKFYNFIEVMFLSVFYSNSTSMEGQSHIIIGSGLHNLPDKEGSFAVLFMEASLIFDNTTCAVQAYKQLEGEAYLWDVTENAKLLEAKLLKIYYPVVKSI